MSDNNDNNNGKLLDQAVIQQYIETLKGDSVYTSMTEFRADRRHPAAHLSGELGDLVRHYQDQKWRRTKAATGFQMPGEDSPHGGPLFVVAKTQLGKDGKPVGTEIRQVDFDEMNGAPKPAAPVRNSNEPLVEYMPGGAVRVNLHRSPQQGTLKDRQGSRHAETEEPKPYLNAKGDWCFIRPIPEKE